MDLNKIEHKVFKVSINDIDDLIDICKDCFPNSFNYQGPRYMLKKKWLLYLKSGSVEIYAIRINNEIACFYELIIDIQLFNQTRKKSEKHLMRYLTYLYVSITKPRCVIPTLKKYMKEKIFTTPAMQINHKGDSFDINKMAWGELQGVHSKYRGSGLSKIMQKHILNRCIELGKNVIGCVNAPDNIPVMNLHKAFGYAIASENKYGFVMKKFLP